MGWWRYRADGFLNGRETDGCEPMRIAITSATSDAGSVAARCLAEAGFEVVGVDRRRVPRFMVSRYLSDYRFIGGDEPCVWDEGVVGFVRESRAEVFLPLCSVGVAAGVRQRTALASMCSVSGPGEEAFLSAWDKLQCMEACEAAGVPCAGSYSKEEAVEAMRRTPGREFVVKPGTDRGSARGVTYVREPAALERAAEEIRAGYGSCLIQDFVAGAASEMRTVVVVLSRSGRLTASFTMRKSRHWPTTGGVTASGRSTHEPELTELVMPFFRAAKWSGAAEVELKRDARDGRFKVIEINPRFPGYLRLPQASGLDLPVLAVRAALGDEPAEGEGLPQYRAGVTYVAPTSFFATAMEDAKEAGWMAAMRRARADARGAGAVVCSLLSDPWPVVTRSVVPEIRG